MRSRTGNLLGDLDSELGQPQLVQLGANWPYELLKDLDLMVLSCRDVQELEKGASQLMPEPATRSRRCILIIYALKLTFGSTEHEASRQSLAVVGHGCAAR